MLSNHITHWTKNLGFVPLLILAGGCDDKNTRSTTSDCIQGEERCSCYPNRSCNDGLVCLSELCVADSAAAGGANATSVTFQASFGGATTSAVDANTQGGSTLNEQGGAASDSTFDASAQGGRSESTSTVVKGGATSAATLAANGGSAANPSSLAPAGGTSGTGGQSAIAGAPAVTGPNLIKDGAFQAFETYWNAILQEGDSGTYTHPPNSSAVCVTNTSVSSSLYYELSFTVGYPNSTADTFVIEPGATYSLSYTVSASYPLEFQVKIGHSASPWTEVYSYAYDVPSSTYKTFTHTFSSATGDTSAGLAFNAVLDLYGKMCFLQVSLTKL